MATLKQINQDLINIDERLIIQEIRLEELSRKKAFYSHYKKARPRFLRRLYRAFFPKRRFYR